MKYYTLLTELRDSVFTAQKKNQMAGLTLNEQQRQKEIAAVELKIKEERTLNLQYAAIAITLITLTLLIHATYRQLIRRLQ